MSSAEKPKPKKRLVIECCWNCEGHGHHSDGEGCRTCGGCGELQRVVTVKEDS